ncbi:MAG: glutamate 5-kinase [Patescibacteria group bacterium]|nr:glutamate 5-kinase [Patescibacteria group bacterium]
MKVVVKIGSNALTTHDGQLNKKIVANLAHEVSQLRKSTGHDFVLVTSGAVSTGRSTISARALHGGKTAVKQTLAAIGQPLLMTSYAEAFGSCGIVCAQILLTWNDFINAERKLTLQEIVNLMLANGIVPVMNENDAISSEELMNAFTDNDQLAALVSILIKADKLVVLTDVDGFLDGSPNNSSSKVIPVIEKIDEYLDKIDDTASNGKGGMRSKLKTAKMVTEQGVSMYIANGKRIGTLTGIIKGNSVGTLFPNQIARKVEMVSVL